MKCKKITALFLVMSALMTHPVMAVGADSELSQANSATSVDGSLSIPSETASSETPSRTTGMDLDPEKLSTQDNTGMEVSKREEAPSLSPSSSLTLLPVPVDDSASMPTESEPVTNDDVPYEEPVSSSVPSEPPETTSLPYEKTEEEHSIIRISNPVQEHLPLDTLVSSDEKGTVVFPEGNTVIDLLFPVLLNGTVITTIGDSAFQGCPYIKSVTIPITVSEIGTNAFADCPNLEYIILVDRAHPEDLCLGENWSGSAQVIFGLIEKQKVVKTTALVYDVTNDTSLLPIDPETSEGTSDVYGIASDTVITPTISEGTYRIDADTVITPVLPEASADPSGIYRIENDTDSTPFVSNPSDFGNPEDAAAQTAETQPETWDCICAVTDPPGIELGAFPDSAPVVPSDVDPPDVSEADTSCLLTVSRE